MIKQRKEEYQCPLEVTMEIIGGKYMISHATPKMLIQQLKELEADGIIERKLYPVVPPKTEYSLTKRGETLVPAIIELNKWGMKYLQEENIPCAYKGDID